MKPTSAPTFVPPLRRGMLAAITLLGAAALLPSCAPSSRKLEYPGGPQAVASLPAGWPAPGPVGRVTVKRYPASRVAVKEGFSPSDSMLSLYAHASKVKVPLSTPIANVGFFDEQGNWKMKSMAYLYPSPSVGVTGLVEDTVVVRDTVPSSALSYAWTGGESAAELLSAKAALDAAAKSRGYQPGAYRLLTYERYPQLTSPKIYELQTQLPR